MKPVTDACVDAQVLAALASGRDVPGREGLLEHLSRCGECRAAAADLAFPEGAATEGVTPRGEETALEALRRSGRTRSIPRWVPASVAAAFLLSVGWILRFQWAATPSPAGPPAATPAPACLPSGEFVAGASVLMTLEPGGSVRRTAEGWLLERGLLLVESPAERVTVGAGTLRVTLTEGTLLLRAGTGAVPSTGLFREAFADGTPDEVRLTLLGGSAMLETAAVTRALKAGDSLRYDGSSLAPAAPLAWAGPSWHPLEPGPLPLPEGSRILLDLPPSSGYVFEALVRKDLDSAELELLFQAGALGWRVPLGNNLLPAGAQWHRIRICADAAGCQAALGERILLDQGREALAGRLPRWDGTGVGLRAWGGTVEVRSARWRPLP